MTRTLIAVLLAAGLAAAGRPRLVVFVSVDQMRPDTLTRFRSEYTGGLRRLLERGLLYRGVLDHAATQTGPGHSTMLTGCHPSTTGIVANGWLDRETWKSVYCCEGENEPVFGVEGKHRSPRLLLRTALGDWMKAADKRAKVYSVSCKDRSAILMGGKRPDGAYWLERRAAGMSTSAYYHAALPEWVADFNDDGWVDKLPEYWTYEVVPGLRADDDPRESDRYSRKSPHPLRKGDRQKTLARMYASPYGDAYVLRFARKLVEQHDLGGDDVTDLIAIGLSSTDTVGHAYGPFSQEIRDTTLRLDRNLGAFFDFLDERKVNYVVVLTSDHGVLPIPDRNIVDSRPLVRRLTVAVEKKLGAGDWFRLISTGQLYVKSAKARAAILEAARAERVFAAVISREELEADTPGLLLRLLRHSYHPMRSGDLFAVPREKALVTAYTTGTSHGSPWRYDREVPILFYGPAIPAGRRGREVRTIDIAPTLAGRIGIRVPEGIDGVALPLR